MLNTGDRHSLGAPDRNPVAVGATVLDDADVPIAIAASVARRASLSDTLRRQTSDLALSYEMCGKIVSSSRALILNFLKGFGVSPPGSACGSDSRDDWEPLELVALEMELALDVVRLLVGRVDSEEATFSLFIDAALSRRTRRICLRSIASFASFSTFHSFSRAWMTCRRRAVVPGAGIPRRRSFAAALFSSRNRARSAMSSAFSSLIFSLTFIAQRVVRRFFRNDTPKVARRTRYSESRPDSEPFGVTVASSIVNSTFFVRMM